MSPDEAVPIAEEEAQEQVEKEAPKEAEQDVPITKEGFDFEAQLQQLVNSAKAAGLSPLKTLVQTYARRGMALVDGVLGALENADTPKKKEK